MQEHDVLWALGGDERYSWAVRDFRDKGFSVKTWGVPGEKDHVPHMQEALAGARLVLLPMKPFCGEELKISGEAVDTARLPELLGEGAILIAGSFPAKIEAWLQGQGIRCVNVLEWEPYLLINGAITAEGAVSLALRAMNRTVAGANILVIGWGRIGEALSRKIQALDGRVTVAVRREEQKTKAKLLGFHGVTTGVYEDGLEKYDLIVNTVPQKIISPKQFETIREDCTLIELASKPGGFPESQHVLQGQGLPGKTAPRTAGEILAWAVRDCLYGEGSTLE